MVFCRPTVLLSAFATFGGYSSGIEPYLYPCAGLNDLGRCALCDGVADAIDMAGPSPGDAPPWGVLTRWYERYQRHGNHTGDSGEGSAGTGGRATFWSGD